VPRSEVAAAELNGKIYLMGGYVKHGDLLEEYDPVKDRWRRRASLPKPLHHIGAAAVNGKIYLIGGYITGVGSVATVYEYDPVVDRWNVKQPMPAGRSGIAAAVLEGKVFVFGGEYNRATRRDVESFNPATNQWQRWTPDADSASRPRRRRRRPIDLRHCRLTSTRRVLLVGQRNVYALISSEEIDHSPRQPFEPARKFSCDEADVAAVAGKIQRH
jgi:N-acetylneuraminic acid mutarotase